MEKFKEPSTDFALKGQYYDLQLNDRLPYLTSPGYLETLGCQGLDFTNPNDKYDSLTFGQCSAKFADKYTIPENSFGSFLNNLQYTFSELTPKQQTVNLNKLQSFINELKSSNDSKNDSTSNLDNIKESFGNSSKKEPTNNMTSNIIITLSIALVVLYIIYNVSLMTQ